MREHTHTNNCSVSNETQNQPKMTRGYLTITLTSLVCVFNAISNTTVVISVVKFRRLQTPANYLLLSLSVADICVALTLPLYVTSEVTDINGTWEMFCLIVNRILMCAGAISILTLALIALDRYIAISRPLKYAWIMTKRKVGILVVFVYIYGTLVSWTPILSMWYTNFTETGICPNQSFNNKSRILFLSAIFTPSCFCIIFCYSKIYYIARQHARVISAIQNIIDWRLNRKSLNFKYSKTIAIIIVIFALFWTPYHVVLLSQVTGIVSPSSCIKQYTLLFAYTNSGVNPWIYAYKNKEFRKAFKQLFTARQENDVKNDSMKRYSLTSQISILSSSGLYDV